MSIHDLASAEIDLYALRRLDFWTAMPQPLYSHRHKCDITSTILTSMANDNHGEAAMLYQKVIPCQKLISAHRNTNCFLKCGCFAVAAQTSICLWQLSPNVHPKISNTFKIGNSLITSCTEVTGVRYAINI